MYVILLLCTRYINQHRFARFFVPTLENERVARLLHDFLMPSGLTFVLRRQDSLVLELSDPAHLMGVSQPCLPIDTVNSFNTSS